MTVTGPAASTFPLHSRGRFSLAASSRFLEGFPAGHGGGTDGAGGARLGLAFPVERDWQPVGVRVTDGPAGLLATVVANPGRPRTAVSSTRPPPGRSSASASG